MIDEKLKDRLIEEEKKTQEILQLIIDTQTLDRFLDKIEPESGDEDLEAWYDPWDFEDTHNTAMGHAGIHLREAYKHLARFKFWVNYTDRLYNDRIAEWEALRGKTKYGTPLRKGRWLTHYTNPSCLKFFEDYEGFKGINKSIYKDYKRITENHYKGGKNEQTNS